MSKPKYAERIITTQVLAAAMKRNVDKLVRRGFDEAFINKLETVRQEATTLNSEQERLKASLKSKTVELGAKLDEMDKMASNAKAFIKLDFPQEQWVEFGFRDKR